MTVTVTVTGVAESLVSDAVVVLSVVVVAVVLKDGEYHEGHVVYSHLVR